jgi:hypothetical protein
MKRFRLIIWLLVFTQCEWVKPKEAAPKLPEATQVGANTFGCLLNGKVWIPKGKSSLFRPNLNASYYPDNQGRFIVSAYQYNKDTDIEERIGLSIDTVLKGSGLRVYLPEVGRNQQTQAIVFTYNDPKDRYFISRDSGVYCWGNINLTRIDRENAIFSGTFMFTLKATGSDTIKITDGRFDIKIGS